MSHVHWEFVAQYSHWILACAGMTGWCWWRTSSFRRRPEPSDLSLRLRLYIRDYAGWTGPTALIRHVSSQSGGLRITGGNGGPVPTRIVRLKLQGSRLARTRAMSSRQEAHPK